MGVLAVRGGGVSKMVLGQIGACLLVGWVEFWSAKRMGSGMYLWLVVDRVS